MIPVSGLFFKTVGVKIHSPIGLLHARRRCWYELRGVIAADYIWAASGGTLALLGLLLVSVLIGAVDLGLAPIFAGL